MNVPTSFSRIIRLLGAGIVASIGLAGCVTGECLEYRDQVVSREVCDQYSDTGWCSARHTETRTQQVCVRRASTGSTSSTFPVRAERDLSGPRGD